MSILKEILNQTADPSLRSVAPAIRNLARRYDLNVVSAQAPQFTPEQLERWLNEPLTMSDVGERAATDSLICLSLTPTDIEEHVRNMTVHIAKARASQDQGKYLFVDSYAEFRD